jgi:hypothetical protein
MRVLNGHYKLDISISILPSGMPYYRYVRGADGLGTRMKLLVGRRSMNTSVRDVTMLHIFQGAL